MDDYEAINKVVYEPPITHADEQDVLIEELQLSLNDALVRIIRLEKLMGQLATAAIASTSAFDVLRQFMHDQTGLAGAAVFDFDTEEEET